MHGKCAEHTFIEVPMGTMVRDAETNEMYADLVRDGQIYVAARGGGGGKGKSRLGRCGASGFTMDGYNRVNQ